MGEQPPAEQAPAETTEYSVFEGLFRRALRVDHDSPLADALREVGFDLRVPKGRYPSEVWRAALDVAARHRFPDLTLEQGHHELGRLFTAGFFETIIGKVIGSIVPLLGTDLWLARMPKFANMTSTGLSLEVERAGEKRWRLRYRSRTASAHFVTGALLGGVDRTKVPVSIEIEARTPGGFDLLVTELR